MEQQTQAEAGAQEFRTEGSPDVTGRETREVLRRYEEERSQQQKAEVDVLLEIVRTEGQKRRGKRKWVIVVVLSYILFMVSLAVITHNSGMMGCLGSISGIVAGMYAASKKHKEAAKELTRFDDIRSVGGLAEALEFHDREMRAVTEEALIRLLPRLNASDATLLDEEQRACLNRALNGKNTRLTLAILRALEQVGDSKSISFVQKLAEGKGRAANDVQIREAASQCLAYLQSGAQQAQARQTLLRASSASAPDPNILLRAASASVVEVDPSQLLRAGDRSTSMQE